MFSKIKKKLKKKYNILSSTILPNNIPEFCVYDVEAILYLYFVNGDIFYISSRSDVVFNEVNINEIAKVGIHNDEIGFYPAKADSTFFKGEYELDTFRFIELIVSNDLNLIVSKIFDEISFFERIVLDYKMMYLLKLKDLVCNISFVDEYDILEMNNNLKFEFENVLKLKITKLASEHLLDTKQKFFDILFSDGIYNTDELLEDKHFISQDMLKEYLNSSNLADSNIEYKTNITINNRTFIITYFIDSIFLQKSINKKIFANTNVIVKGIDLCGYLDMLYLNADIRVEFGIYDLVIKNNVEHNLIFHSIDSIFSYENKHNKVSMEGLDKDVKDEVVFKLDFLLKDLHLYLDSKIHHKISVEYTKNDTRNRLVGSSVFKISNMLDSIFEN